MLHEKSTFASKSDLIQLIFLLLIFGYGIYFIPQDGENIKEK